MWKEAKLLMAVTQMQLDDSIVLHRRRRRAGLRARESSYCCHLTAVPTSISRLLTVVVFIPNPASPNPLHLTYKNKQSSLVQSGKVQIQFVPASAGCCMILVSTSLATESLLIYSSCHSPGCYVWSFKQHLAELQATCKGLWRKQT